MKAGMVLGLIGGVFSLLVGAIGYKVSSGLGMMAMAVDYQDGARSMEFYKAMALVLPVVGLIGAGLSGKNTKIAALLMAISAAGTIWVFGVRPVSIICAGLLGVGAFLVLTGAPKNPNAQS